MTTTTFATPRPVHVRVELGAGTVTIDASGADSASSVVELAAADDHPDGPAAVAATAIDQHGDELLVKVPRPWRGHRAPPLALRMAVPAESRLSIDVTAADVAVTGRVGTSALNAGSGDVTVATVEGDVRISSGSGDIEVGSVAGAAKLRAGSGTVRVGHTATSAHVGTGSGDVTIERADGDVLAKSGSGDLRIGRAQGSAALSSGSGHLFVDRIGAGSLSAKTASGHVEVGVGDGVVVWLDVQTVSGDIGSTLAESDAPVAGEPVLELRARTVSGDIRIHRVATDQPAPAGW